jgi:hypothetical protein
MRALCAICAARGTRAGVSASCARATLYRRAVASLASRTCLAASAIHALPGGALPVDDGAGKRCEQQTQPHSTARHAHPTGHWGSQLQPHGLPIIVHTRISVWCCCMLYSAVCDAVLGSTAMATTSSGYIHYAVPRGRNSYPAVQLYTAPFTVIDRRHRSRPLHERPGTGRS